MLYMPASTIATPILLQQTAPPPPPPPPAQYVMLQPAPTFMPTLPLLNSSFVYPSYSFLTKTEPKTDNDTSSKQQQQQVITQHIVHHCTCSSKSCAGYCELCCPWKTETCQRKIQSPPSTPPTYKQQRHSRRDDYEQPTYDSNQETIDEKIARIRRELSLTSFNQRDKSTETIDYYHPPPPRSTTPPAVPYKQHYDAPKPRSLSRPRSASSHRDSSLPRQPWRSSNQNDYPWRDSHLPAYREATLARSQTPVNETRQWSENAHKQSHTNTQNSTTYYANRDFIYRPKSETEARKWYTQTTGKDANREVYQALNPCYTTSHSFYSDVPTKTATASKTHCLNKIDATPYHNLYQCTEPCLHIIPKHASSVEPPYMKILNAPVTYLH